MNRFFPSFLKNYGTKSLLLCASIENRLEQKEQENGIHYQHREPLLFKQFFAILFLWSQAYLRAFDRSFRAEQQLWLLHKPCCCNKLWLVRDGEPFRELPKGTCSGVRVRARVLICSGFFDSSTLWVLYGLKWLTRLKMGPKKLSVWGGKVQTRGAWGGGEEFKNWVTSRKQRHWNSLAYLMIIFEMDKYRFFAHYFVRSEMT